MRSLPKNLFIILVLRYPKLNNASKIPVRNLTPYIVGTDSRNNVLVGTEKFCRVLLLRGLGLPLRDQKREQIGSGTDVWTDGWTDGRTDSPCILQDFVPSGSLRGRCPAYLTANIKKCQSRARVPISISCLWATGLSFHIIFVVTLNSSKSTGVYLSISKKIEILNLIQKGKMKKEACLQIKLSQSTLSMIIRTYSIALHCHEYRVTQKKLWNWKNRCKSSQLRHCKHHARSPISTNVSLRKNFYMADLSWKKIHTANFVKFRNK